MECLRLNEANVRRGETPCEYEKARLAAAASYDKARTDRWANYHDTGSDALLTTGAAMMRAGQPQAPQPVNVYVVPQYAPPIHR